ncbi:VOC family protein [uncultured Tateyamaria sp.]|uniref:bleomycin resistance protein n=1 Tax=uncultured Tateyamaria sp. TaxID=455651 RepID=UPI002634F4A4|nr:VOC family protein [uncultured Tateyamaria sp.]
MLEQVCPIMPSRDLGATEAFYSGWGFATWYKDDGYLLINRDRVELHFFHNATHRPEDCDHGAYIRPQKVDEVSDLLAGLGLPAMAGFPRFLPAENKPSGMREATLWDPDGNLLRIGEVITNG